MEWKEVRLGDVCEIYGRIGFRGYTTNDLVDTPKEGAISLSPKNIINGELNLDQCTYIKWDKYYESPEIMLKPNEIVITKTGSSVGRTTFVRRVAHPMTLNPQLVVLKNITENAEFLSYYIKSSLFQSLLKSIVVGSAIPTLSQKNLANLKINVPKELDDQRRIASILSSLDRKIELNNKINADLEEMAQAIFKNWFVDFEPFKDGKFVNSELGMIPEGWKVISLSEIMKYNGGSQPPASEFMDTYQEGYVRFIQIRDYDNDSHITYIPISKRNKLCDELDIMIARYGAALGRICWGLKGAYNVALAKVTPLKSYYREYLRCYLNTSYFYQSINNKGARCAQSGFNQSDINSYMIAFPIDEIVVMNFNDLCSSIMDKRLSLKYENSHLSLLRDTLLPRLMSGEIEVPE